MKFFKYILFVALAMSVASCFGDGVKKLKNEYIEACAEGDFDKAHTVAAKIEAVDSDEANEALKYVNDKEIYYLLAKPSQDNDNRILYLYNTYEEYQLPDMTDVLEVAVSMDNNNLAMKLFKAGVMPNAKIVNSASSRGMEDFVTEVQSYLPEYLQTQINEIKRSIPTFHSEGVVESSEGICYSEKIEGNEEEYKMPSENAAISRYNKKLRDIYSIALQINREDIALKAVNAMLPKIEAYRGDYMREWIHGYKVDGGYYLIYHNYDEINRLKSELE